MRQSYSKDFISALTNPKKLWIIVCGRPNTKAVNTLWQYKVNVIPCCKDVKLWYCKQHIGNAPEMVKEIPSEKDTIAKRYVQAVIGGVLQMMTLFYALVLLRFDIKLFFISPLLIGLAFLIGNATSSLSLTLLFGSIIAVPGLLFYAWLKQGNI